MRGWWRGDMVMVVSAPPFFFNYSFLVFRVSPNAIVFSLSLQVDQVGWEEGGLGGFCDLLTLGFVVK